MKGSFATRRYTSRWVSCQPALAKAGGTKDILGIWIEQNGVQPMIRGIMGPRHGAKF